MVLHIVTIIIIICACLVFLFIYILEVWNHIYSELNGLPWFEDKHLNKGGMVQQGRHENTCGGLL